MEGEANRPANPHLAPSGYVPPTAPRRARRIRESAEQNRSSAAYRQGRLRTQPADCRTEQDANRNGVRAEQDVLPAGAERTAIRRRYAGTPAAPQPPRRDISNECTERTGSGISRTRQVESTSHQHAPSAWPRTPAPSVRTHAETGRSHEVEDEANHRRICTWRRAVPYQRQRREERDESGNAPSRTGHQRPTARAGCERNPRTTSPSRTPTTTESAPSVPRRATERASRIQTGQRAQRHAVTYAPSGNIDRTTRSHAPSNRPSQGHRAAAPHDAFFHRRAAEGAQTTSTSSPRSGGRCQPHQFRHLAPSGTFQQTAPRQAHTRGPPRRAQRRLPPSPHRAVHFGPKTPSAARFSDATPERRQCSATTRDEHLDEPTERTGPRMSSDTQNCPLATSKTDPRRNGVCRRV